MGNDLYRSRLGNRLNKKVLKFLSSLEDDLWIAQEDVIGTEVHNIMLFEQNILNKNELKKILISLKKIKEKFTNKQIILDHTFEDIHPLIEKWVIDAIGIEIGGKIHTGRSRNDQISVDLRLKIRNELNSLSKKLFRLTEKLLALSKRTINFFMPLYTHFQRGQLGVFSHYITNYISQILRSLERIDEIYKRINLNPLGACAIGGTSININRKRTAELLGFEGIVENSIDAISSKDYLFETLTCLSLISIQFSRIAEDLLIWSTKEFDFIELDDQYCSVSSVMPQKKNPDTLELIRSKASKIISNLFTASMIIKAIPTGYFRDFQDLQNLLKNSFNLIFSIIEIFIGVFSSIVINKEKMINAINESFILALDLAELLVNEYSIPFRQSHKIVGKLVKNSKTPEDLFNNKNLENVIFEVERKKIRIPNNFIESIKNLDNCLEKRKSQGSPSKIEVNKLINDLNKKKELLFRLYLKRIEDIKKSKILREKLIEKIIT